MNVPLLKSFGHSGFTGNLTWADPDSGILYVFLSNRVYPDAENHKLISMNIRTEIMNIITNACNYSTAEEVVRQRALLNNKLKHSDSE